MNEGPTCAGRAPHQVVRGFCEATKSPPHGLRVGAHNGPDSSLPTPSPRLLRCHQTTCQDVCGDGLAAALVKGRFLGYRCFSRARRVTKKPMIQSIQKNRSDMSKISGKPEGLYRSHKAVMGRSLMWPGSSWANRQRPLMPQRSSGWSPVLLPLVLRWTF